MRNQEFHIQTLQNNNSQAITRLEVQIGQLANSKNERPKGILPSQLLTNSQNSKQVNLAEDQQFNQCNIVHTLRSVKKVDI